MERVKLRIKIGRKFWLDWKEAYCKLIVPGFHTCQTSLRGATRSRHVAVQSSSTIKRSYLKEEEARPDYWSSSFSIHVWIRLKIAPWKILVERYLFSKRERDRVLPSTMFVSYRAEFLSCPRVPHRVTPLSIGRVYIQSVQMERFFLERKKIKKSKVYSLETVSTRLLNLDLFREIQSSV